MKPEDFIGSEVFWAAAAVVVALSVAIGSLITVGINAWTKHRERPEADWAVDMNVYANLDDPYGGEAGIQVYAKISNVGDGGAFRVSLDAENCTARFASQETQGMSAHAYMPPGSVIPVAASMGLDAWDSAKLELVWTEPPTRLGKKRRYDITPRVFVEEPLVQTTHPKSGEVTRRPLSEVLAAARPEA